MSEPCKVRLAVAADARFVHSAWLLGACDPKSIGAPRDAGAPSDGSRWSAAFASLDRFHRKAQQWLVPQLMKRCEVLVACSPDDPDLNYGFVAFKRLPSGQPALLYAYVKEKLRGNGVFRSLWREATEGQPSIAAYTSPALDRFASRYGIAHDPDLAWEIAEGRWP